MLQDKLNNYGNVMAYNFHTPYLLYPLYDPHGASESGIVV